MRAGHRPGGTGAAASPSVPGARPRPDGRGAREGAGSGSAHQAGDGDRPRVRSAQPGRTDQPLAAPAVPRRPAGAGGRTGGNGPRGAGRPRRRRAARGPDRRVHHGRAAAPAARPGPAGRARRGRAARAGPAVGGRVRGARHHLAPPGHRTAPVERRAQRGARRGGTAAGPGQPAPQPGGPAPAGDLRWAPDAGLPAMDAPNGRAGGGPWRRGLGPPGDDFDPDVVTSAYRLGEDQIRRAARSARALAAFEGSAPPFAYVRHDVRPVSAPLLDSRARRIRPAVGFADPVLPRGTVGDAARADRAGPRPGAGGGCGPAVGAASSRCSPASRAPERHSAPRWCRAEGCPGRRDDREAPARRTGPRVARRPYCRTRHRGTAEEDFRCAA